MRRRLTPVFNPRGLFSFEFSDVICASVNRLIMTQANTLRLLETIWRMQNVEDRKLILQESLFKSKET